MAAELGLDDYKQKRPRFVVSNKFEFDRFDQRPNFVIAQSLFTHLAPDDIVLCLKNLKTQCSEQCRFFATFRKVDAAQQNPPESHSHPLFCDTRAEMPRFADEAGWTFRYIGDHPREQRVAEFRPRPVLPPTTRSHAQSNRDSEPGDMWAPAAR